MSTEVLSALVLAANFTVYPPPTGTPPRVEAITDKGPILELIVRCPQGSAIISYSKVERLFCGPRMKCGSNREAALKQACG